MKDMKLMFAYGANMHRANMLFRAPHSVFVSIALLNNWKIGVITSGWLGIAHDLKSHVWGVLYWISPTDENKIDTHEEVDRGIYKKSILPVSSFNSNFNALVYVPNEPLNGIVQNNYLARCINAAENRALPDEWIQKLRSLTTIKS